MKDFKEIIANKLSKIIDMDINEIKESIEIPKDTKHGDYAFPCFKLAKTLRKSPQLIAQDLKEQIELDENINNVEAIGGFINFYINKNILTLEVFKQIESNEEYGKSKLGNGKNIIVEYSSPNIAKPFHIGHLRTTLIGNALYNVYKYLGFNTTSINHLGDYGTQFGKMIEGYKLWGNEYDLTVDPINKMMDIYVRINELCKKDEEVLERCRENFKLLEKKDSYCLELWNKFKNLSMIEFNKIYDLLGVKFDVIKGESFYADKTDEVIKKLKEKNVLIESDGAKIVDLSESGIDTPCLIQKANGSSIYASRDLAAIMYRAKTYDFDKCLYVVAYEQNLYFKQIFEVAKYLVDEKYQKGLIHVSYGMVSLTTGKMSTRLKKKKKIDELLNKTINKAKEIILEKNPNLENKDEIAKKVGIGAIIFNTLSTSNIKDEIFDWDVALNFQGETGPYIQYTYVRTKSILDKVDKIEKVENIDITKLEDEYSQNIIKLIYNFEDILVQVINKNEPSILARYLIDLSKAFSLFYNENKIVVDDENEKNARIYLTYCVSKVLKQGTKLLGMQMPEKM